jgi:hypothetical protein
MAQLEIFDINNPDMYDETGVLKKEYFEHIFRLTTLQPSDVIGKVANSIFQLGEILNPELHTE